MSFNKKRLLVSTVSLTTFASITVAISCSSIVPETKTKEPEKIEKPVPIQVPIIKKEGSEKPIKKDKSIQEIKINLDSKLSNVYLNSKNLSYLTFNKQVTKMLVDQEVKNLQPLVLRSKKQLIRFLNNWKNSLLNKFDTDEKTQRDLGLSKLKLTEMFDDFMKQIIKQFNSEYFDKNLIVIDFGNKYSALGQKSKYFFDTQIIIKNLVDIYPSNNKIIITYDVSDKKVDDNSELYSVFYSLNKKQFNLRNENYTVVKRSFDKKRQTPISKRALEVASYITQDLSRYPVENDYNNWIRNRLWENFASIVLHSKREFNTFVNEFAKFYRRRYKKDFPKSQMQNMMETYNDEYFKDNKLVLLSAYDYVSNNDLFNDFIENSYDLKLKGNELTFTIFKKDTRPTNDALTPQDHVVFENKSKDEGQLMHQADGRRQHTLFLKLPRNLISLNKKLKVIVEVENQNFYWSNY
ncbi:hypothetical protein [Mycoplasmopsis agassizii]|uniref:Lipoprotein n=1 Tax=Mycoplasmopsis agassizii TaxID=33922 RepID=A0ABX4H4W0_9BACT|nr:hypothetical protein [Mycoplasmopsis agassizii]PAF54926.1 hypothetical protein CJF60_04280 [Mycoplasmopsis agassizii]SMC17123.1 hypothetical protein SAMN02745179_00396 [Mycoplasmopsis agassizii]